MPSPVRPRALRPILLLLAIVGGCASTGQQTTARPSNGITLVLKDDAKCRTNGTVETAMANDELCSTLVAWLRNDLTRAGFTVASQDAPANALTLAVAAVQSGSQSAQAADLLVEVRISSGGDEIEVFSQSGEVDQSATHGQLATVVRALADNLASSKRLQAAAADAPSGGPAAAL